MFQRCGIFLLLMCPVIAVADDQPASEAEQTVEVGKSAPDFEATGIDGKVFRLSDKLKTGKHVVLIFSRANW